mmetsp:Transcript_35818/g.78455  ORF Transcript_35818/g.78455 Transcript_35818/m.78455 type:complete len:209 (+) Transcript_35818:806-1432(+)
MTSWLVLPVLFTTKSREMQVCKWRWWDCSRCFGFSPLRAGGSNVLLVTCALSADSTAAPAIGNTLPTARLATRGDGRSNGLSAFYFCLSSSSKLRASSGRRGNGPALSHEMRLPGSATAAATTLLVPCATCTTSSMSDLFRHFTSLLLMLSPRVGESGLSSDGTLRSRRDVARPSRRSTGSDGPPSGNRFSLEPCLDGFPVQLHPAER